MCTSKGINMVQRLQSAAARIIFGNFEYVNVRGEDIVRALKWPTVYKNRKAVIPHCHIDVQMGPWLAPNCLCDQDHQVHLLTV